MTLTEACKRFPTRESCVWHLERVVWRGGPVCPYCRSANQTPSKGTFRRHCNNCNTSYSATVGTIFHQTHIDLRCWFVAIARELAEPGSCTARRLSNDISVSKDTACRMLAKIRNASHEELALLKKVVDAGRMIGKIGTKGKASKKRITVKRKK